jgi:lipoprotein-releasing system ATP-binding protein
MILQTQNVTKLYAAKAGIQPVEVLKGVNLSVEEGSITAIVGSSGSGKSTLMHILGGLDKPTSGNVQYKNEDISFYSESRLSQFRNKEIGFVFQFHHLMPEFTSLENVMMPALIRPHHTDTIKEKATNLLSQFGLADRLNHRPSMLSGGEQQRVAMARALINDPAVLLADEPTGNLDEANTLELLELILKLRSKNKLSIVMVTHDIDIAKRCDITYTLRNGVLD